MSFLRRSPLSKRKSSSLSRKESLNSGSPLRNAQDDGRASSANSSTSVGNGLLSSFADVVLDSMSWSISVDHKGDVPNKEHSESTTWIFDVKTGDTEYAGTKSAITIDVYGAHGGLFDIVLNPDGQKFARASTVSVTINDRFSQDIGPLRKLRVRSDNSGSKSSWFLDSIVARKQSAKLGDSEHYVFKCNNWLSDEYGDGELVREMAAEGPYCEKRDEKLRIPLKYVVQVYTGGSPDIKGHAGTDANVHITLEGSVSDSGVRSLVKKKGQGGTDLFEAGKMDEFEIMSLGLGELRKVRIGHDNGRSLSRKLSGKGGGAGWFLDKVVIIDPVKQGANIVFPCSRWLHEGKDDGHIERTLVREAEIPKATYTVTIQSKVGKGPLRTPPVPTIRFHGSRSGESAETEQVKLFDPDRKYKQESSTQIAAKEKEVYVLELPLLDDIKHVTVWYDVTKMTPLNLTTTSNSHRSTTTSANRSSPVRNTKDESVWKIQYLSVEERATVDGNSFNSHYYCNWPSPLGEGHNSNLRVALQRKELERLEQANTSVVAKKQNRASDANGTWTPSGLWVRKTDETDYRPAMEKKTSCWNKEYEAKLRDQRKKKNKPLKEKAELQQDSNTFSAENTQGSAVRKIEQRFKEIMREKAKKKKEEEEKAMAAVLSKKRKEAQSKLRYEKWCEDKKIAEQRKRSEKASLKMQTELSNQRRAELNLQAVKQWKIKKSQSVCKPKNQTGGDHYHNSISGARNRNSKERKGDTNKHFCPVPHQNKPNGGAVYIGSSIIPGPHLQQGTPQRWLYGGRLRAGHEGDSCWEY